jgi:SAM-dependent methyltransferase
MQQPSLPWQAFQTIYREQRWGHGSGPGSSPANTIEYRAFIERFITANRIRTVTDFGCGDWQFSYLIDWSQVDYTGIDIVPEIIECNRNRFTAPNIRFQVLNAIDELPGGDLLLSKEVLQHLPNHAVIDYLPVIRKKYRFALLTNAIEPTAANIDVAAGGWRPVRLQDAPFNTAGAVIFTYFPQAGNVTFKNATFLMLGDA